MGHFLHVILRLVLLRGSPAALPETQTVLSVVVAVFVVTAPLFLEWLGDGSVGIGAYFAAMVFVYGGYAALLLLNGRRDRLNRTMLAVMGTDLMLATAQAVLVTIAEPMGAHPGWLTLFVYFWLIIVHSRILGAALDWSPVLAFVFVFAMSVLGQSLLAAMSSATRSAAVAVPSAAV